MLYIKTKVNIHMLHEKPFVIMFRHLFINLLPVNVTKYLKEIDLCFNKLTNRDF